MAWASLVESKAKAQRGASHGKCLLPILQLWEGVAAVTRATKHGTRVERGEQECWCAGLAWGHSRVFIHNPELSSCVQTRSHIHEMNCYSTAPTRGVSTQRMARRRTKDFRKTAHSLEFSDICFSVHVKVSAMTKMQEDKAQAGLLRPWPGAGQGSSAQSWRWPRPGSPRACSPWPSWPSHSCSSGMSQPGPPSWV